MSQKNTELFLALFQDLKEELMPMPNEADRKRFETMGFKFTGPAQANFLPCEYPAGWKKVQWDIKKIYILDEQDRRRAFMTLIAGNGVCTGESKPLTRISIEKGKKHEKLGTARAMDNKTVLASFSANIDESKNRPFTEAQTEAIQAAIDKTKLWADQALPDWEDPMAYWDWDVKDLFALTQKNSA